MNYIFKLIRTWIVLLLISFFILTMSYVIADRWGLVVGLLLSSVLVILTLFVSPSFPMLTLQGQKLAGRDPWGLLELTHRLSQQIKCPQPEVWRLPKKEPLILIIGPSLFKPSLAFSEGLLSQLKREELEAIIALSLTTLKQKSHWISQFFDRGGMTFLSLLDFLKKNSPSFFHPLWRGLLYPVICLFFKLALPISHQLKADVEAKKYLDNPFVLAQTLWKIYGSLINEDSALPFEVQHYLLIHPQTTRQSWAQLHPNIQKRLIHLVGYFPI